MPNKQKTQISFLFGVFFSFLDSGPGGNQRGRSPEEYREICQYVYHEVLKQGKGTDDHILPLVDWFFFSFLLISSRSHCGRSSSQERDRDRSAMRQSQVELPWKRGPGVFRRRRAKNHSLQIRLAQKTPLIEENQILSRQHQRRQQQQQLHLQQQQKQRSNRQLEETQFG